MRLHKRFSSSLLHPRENALKDMLDMNALEAVFHQNWLHLFMNGGFIHDFAHNTLGYILEDIHGTAEPYQHYASELSEANAEPLDAIFAEPFYNTDISRLDGLNSKSGYIAVVQAKYDAYYRAETSLRVLTWVIGARTGIPYNQIRNSFPMFGRTTTKQLASEYNIKYTSFGDYNQIDSGIANNPYIIGQHYYKDMHLPEGSNGIEDFKPFLTPTSKEIGAIYNRAMRVRKLLEQRVKELSLHKRFSTDKRQAQIQAVLSSIRMRDVVSSIKGQKLEL